MCHYIVVADGFLIVSVCIRRYKALRESHRKQVNRLVNATEAQERQRLQIAPSPHADIEEDGMTMTAGGHIPPPRLLPPLAVTSSSRAIQPVNDNDNGREPRQARDLTTAAFQPFAADSTDQQSVKRRLIKFEGEWLERFVMSSIVTVNFLPHLQPRRPDLDSRI